MDGKCAAKSFWFTETFPVPGDSHTRAIASFLFPVP